MFCFYKCQFYCTFYPHNEGRVKATEMFDWFKKKRDKNNNLPNLLDLDGNPLHEGDTVVSQRYNLGKCQIMLEGTNYIYESITSGEKVSWIKMVDASSERQKVKLVKDENK